jgi:hypothetical protein
MSQGTFSSRWAVLWAVLSASVAVDAAEKSAVTANVEVASGAHAGKYAYESSDACIIASSDKSKAAGFSVIVMSDRSQLSIDMPSVEPEHVNEVHIELVVADVKPNQSRKDTATTKYMIDTRPDAALAAYQRADRAGKGISGKATAQLTQTGETAQLSFSAQTADGVKIDGSIDCRTVDREFGR